MDAETVGTPVQRTGRDWEHLWAPYDRATYAAALAAVKPGDIVLDIGAGDLRLTRRLAGKASRVYAIELNASLVAMGTVPANVTVIQDDARTAAFPREVTTAVLLMRHCRHFALYWRKLAATNCRRLITNARWGMGVECIDVKAPRLPYAVLELGWYACSCGGTGFVSGSPERLTRDLMNLTFEVEKCPCCHTLD